jgi:dCMP deaminase
MGIAQVVAGKSKDPSTKVGAVIVDRDNRVVSTGYNGFVSGCNESVLSYDRPMKYHYVIHAELNAIIQSKIDLRGCKMFTTYAPCVNCLKHILQSGIREVFYEDSSIMKRTDYLENIAIVNLIRATGATIMSVSSRMRLEEEIRAYHDSKSPVHDKGED